MTNTPLTNNDSHLLINLYRRIEQAVSREEVKELLREIAYIEHRSQLLRGNTHQHL
jgi:hypothetical protein